MKKNSLQDIRMSRLSIRNVLGRDRSWYRRHSVVSPGAAERERTELWPLTCQLWDTWGIFVKIIFLRSGRSRSRSTRTTRGRERASVWTCECVPLTFLHPDDLPFRFLDYRSSHSDTPRCTSYTNLDEYFRKDKEKVKGARRTPLEIKSCHLFTSCWHVISRHRSSRYQHTQHISAWAPRGQKNEARPSSFVFVVNKVQKRAEPFSTICFILQEKQHYSEVPPSNQPPEQPGSWFEGLRDCKRVRGCEEGVTAEFAVKNIRLRAFRRRYLCTKAFVIAALSLKTDKTIHGRYFHWFFMMWFCWRRDWVGGGGVGDSARMLVRTSGFHTANN